MATSARATRPNPDEVALHRDLLAALSCASHRDESARAQKVYGRWPSDPSHPGLRYERVHASEPIWSIRIDLNHRALGLRDAEGIAWFWIGSHADYDRMLDRR